MPEDIRREQADFDVVIVGGGPAGLAAAIRLKQCAAAAGRDVSVCLVEKGAEIGAHTLSGALIDPSALTELFPDGCDAPLDVEVRDDRFYYLTEKAQLRIPGPLLPPNLRNRGTRIASLGRLCRWLAQQAEALGVEIYPGFAAVACLFEDGRVAGVVTGDAGVGKDGTHKAGFAPGMALRGKYTLFAEGARGHLAKRLIARFRLDADCDVPKFGAGLKELWRLAPQKHRAGLAIHTIGWPLDHDTGGGLFMYHWAEDVCAVGLVVHLDYRNPHLSPFEEFQRAKAHPLIRRYLDGGTRIGFGARAVSEGGWPSVPKLTFPGGALLGCAAGLMNAARIKGIHTAMASGMRAAEAAIVALGEGRSNDELSAYEQAVRDGAIGRELKPAANFKPLWSRFGTHTGIALAGTDMWCRHLFGFTPFGRLRHKGPDCAALRPAASCRTIVYPKPDGVLRFDRPSSLFLANVHHEEDQPAHLLLGDPSLPLGTNLSVYGEPAQLYCPAGVFEIVAVEGKTRFQINAANCLHCKICDIKDPAQTITWVPPEGGGGPNYGDM